MCLAWYLTDVMANYAWSWLHLWSPLISRTLTIPVYFTCLFVLMTDSFVSNPICLQSSFTSSSFSSAQISDDLLMLKYLYLMLSVILGFSKLTNLSDISFSPVALMSSKFIKINGPVLSTCFSSQFSKGFSEIEISQSKVKVVEFSKNTGIWLHESKKLINAVSYQITCSLSHSYPAFPKSSTPHSSDPELLRALLEIKIRCIGFAWT